MQLCRFSLSAHKHRPRHATRNATAVTLTSDPDGPLRRGGVGSHSGESWGVEDVLPPLPGVGVVAAVVGLVVVALPPPGPPSAPAGTAADPGMDGCAVTHPIAARQSRVRGAQAARRRRERGRRRMGLAAAVGEGIFGPAPFPQPGPPGPLRHGKLRAAGSGEDWVRRASGVAGVPTSVRARAGQDAQRV